MTLRRRSWLDGCCSKSPRRTGHTMSRRALRLSIKQITRAAALPLSAAATSGSVLFGAASEANLKVVGRVRPLNAREQESNTRNVIKVADEHMLVFDPKIEEDVFFFHGDKQRQDITERLHIDQNFVSEKVFGPDSTNLHILESTTEYLMDTLLDGHNCSEFAYGATGAGKTFTRVGKPGCPGITLLTLMELYARIDAMEADNPGHGVEVAVSYLEVYNETLRDLLQPGKPLQVQESGQQVLVLSSRWWVSKGITHNNLSVAKFSKIDLAGSSVALRRAADTI